jgi:hypothetical protein
MPEEVGKRLSELLKRTEAGEVSVKGVELEGLYISSWVQNFSRAMR